MSLPVYLYLKLHPAYQSKNEDIYPQSLVLRLLQHPQEEEWSYHVAPEGLQERKDGSVCKALERGRCEVIGSALGLKMDIASKPVISALKRHRHYMPEIPASLSV